MVVWLDVCGCLKELLRIYGVFLVNLWEVIGHLWRMGFSWENSALLACLCDFLQSVRRIVVILVPNGRLFRYLHLGMWFVIFSCLWWDRWPFPLGAIFKSSCVGFNWSSASAYWIISVCRFCPVLCIQVLVWSIEHFWCAGPAPEFDSLRDLLRYVWLTWLFARG